MDSQNRAVARALYEHELALGRCGQMPFDVVLEKYPETVAAYERKASAAISAHDTSLREELNFALGLKTISDLPPEGERTKLQERQAAYAALFNQLNPVLSEIKELKATQEKEWKFYNHRLSEEISAKEAALRQIATLREAFRRFIVQSETFRQNNTEEWCEWYANEVIPEAKQAIRDLDGNS